MKDKNKSKTKKKKRKGFQAGNMRCPYCGSPVIFRSADGIYHDNSKGMMLYVCSHYPQCDAYVRVHAGTKIPVGSLANHELRTLRRTAHQYFDQLHQSGYMSKQDAYQWLADLISAPLSEAHIGHLGEYYCKQVIEESRRLLGRYQGQKNKKTVPSDERRRGIMTLTEKQQKKVEENMGLVHQVIHDKVHGYSQWGFHTYDDLFQIGCIGLCKAAATDKGGTFSTYAYRLIWHELCDALIQSTKRYADEVAADVTPYISAGTEDGEALSGLRMDLSQVLSSARKDAPPSTAKGIDAMVLMSQGYTSREIGERMGASARLVCAWVSKARKFLKDRPETEAIAVYCS